MTYWYIAYHIVDWGLILFVCIMVYKIFISSNHEQGGISRRI